MDLSVSMGIGVGEYRPRYTSAPLSTTARIVGDMGGIPVWLRPANES